MRKFAFLFIVLSVFIWSSQIAAMQPRRYSEDEAEFFGSVFDSCKQSVTANISEKDFQKTLCFAHLKGTQEAAREIGMTFGMLLAGYSETHKDLGDTLKLIEERLCAPENLGLQQFAKDYVAYVESADYKPYIPSALSTEAATAKRPSGKFYESPAALFSRIYECKKQNDAK